MLKVYGASDDLMEFEGDFTAEIGESRAGQDGEVLAFSDGSLIAVSYDGCWRFDIRAIGSSNPQKTFCATDSDADQYSDIIEFSGPVKWAVYGKRAD